MYRLIKRFLIKYDLKKNIRTLTRNRYFFNFNTAKKIAILFTCNTEMEKEVYSLMNYFRSKHISIEALGYYNDKIIPPNFVPMPNIKLFCNHDLNWYGKPSNENVNEFIKKTFDILIDFNISSLPVIHYISTLSMAKMKVGRQAYPDNPYDFILSTGETIDHHLFVEELKHYLHTIDMKND